MAFAATPWRADNLMFVYDRPFENHESRAIGIANQPRVWVPAYQWLTIRGRSGAPRLLVHNA